MTRTRNIGMALRVAAIAAVCALFCSPFPLGAATVTVINAGDEVNGDVSSIAALEEKPGTDGVSLREALLAANNDTGANEVTFDISTGDPGFDPGSGQWIISPVTPYPDITVGSLLIDGYSQTQNRGDTNPAGPEILINGSSVTAGPCFTLASSGNSIKSLAIRHFDLGIRVIGDANTIGPGNEIASNTVGVVVSDAAAGNTITENAIYANREMGISLEDNGNAGIPPPTLRYFGGVVKGFAAPGGVVEVFSDSGEGGEFYPGTQGEHYLGSVVAGANGGFGLVVSAPDPYINATVTDADGNTSMFSRPARPLVVVSNSGTDEKPGNTVSIIDALAFSVVDTVEVGSRPAGIAGSRTGHIHVVNNDSNSVSVIFPPVDTRVTTTIPVGEEPLAIAGGQDQLYVVNTGPDPQTTPGTLWIMDAATLNMVEVVPLGRRPSTVRVLDIAGENVLAVPNLYDDNITIIDGRTLQVTRTITAGDFPSDLCAGRNGLIYVANIGNGATDSVSVIDFGSGRTVARLFTGLGPIAVVRDPNLGFVAVANSVSGTVSIIDEGSGRVVKDIPVGLVPTHLAVVPGKYIYVTDFASSLVGPAGKIMVISLSSLSVIASIEVGPFPNYIEVLSSEMENWFPNGIDLVSSPSAVRPGGTVTLGYVVSPGLLDRGDIILGLETPGGALLSFGPDLGRLTPAGSNIASIERFAENIPLSAPAWGRFDLTVPAGVPPGDYAFIGVVLRQGTNDVVQIARSNVFKIIAAGGAGQKGFRVRLGREGRSRGS